MRPPAHLRQRKPDVMAAELSGLRIGLLTASASRLGGGVYEAVVRQAKLIHSRGGEARVFALDDEYSRTDAGRFGDSEIEWSRVRGPAQIGYAPDLLPQLLGAKLDCLHLHGVWMYPSRAAHQWKQLSGGGYIISPHGMLDRWITSRGRWKKSLARLGYERSNWASASFLHALTDREAADIAAESGRHDSVVIPNPAPEVEPGQIAQRLPQLAYIGRIHPKKNLLALIAGWLQARRPAGSRLTLAGWGASGDVATLRDAVAAAGQSVEFVGPLFGHDKQALLNNSRFVILPSFSEGLPMAILESWAAATPTIMTDECNLPEGFVGHAALRCGTSPDAIASAIEHAFTHDDAQWLELAANARTLAASTFSTQTIGTCWAKAYMCAISLGRRNIL